MLRRHPTAFRTALLALVLQVIPVVSASALADGGIVRVNVFNGWKAFEVITQGDDPAGDGLAYAMPDKFDGAGAWLAAPHTLRVQVNHESSDAAISAVDLDIVALQVAIANMIDSDSTGGVGFVMSARQAYDRWSADGGANWTVTASTSNTSFYRFCSSQAYAPDTFGTDRGFVDQLYITGEEGDDGRLFVLDSATRDLYQLSGTVGSAPGGTGGMPFDKWENAALLDTGETGHVALLLSPDGGSESLQLYVGVKGQDAAGAASADFLARNGLAYGSWYYLHGAFPALGATNGGSFGTASAGALSSDKLEDIDTSPVHPTRAVLGDQTSGVFTFDFQLVFDGGFDAGASSFTVTKVANTSGGLDSLNNPDNVDWTAATTLGGTSYPDGLIFVNEDNDSGEIWRMEPDGSGKLKIAATTVGAESTGIFDLSEVVGYLPGSILITNGQGSPSSMSVLVNPDASLAPDPLSAWTDLGHALAGTHGEPSLVGTGTFEVGTTLSLSLTDARENSTAYFVLGLGSVNLPFYGGTLVPAFEAPLGLFLALPTDAGGSLLLSDTWPGGVPGGTELAFQHWIVDPLAPFGLAASNAVKGITP